MVCILLWLGMVNRPCHTERQDAFPHERSEAGCPEAQGDPRERVRGATPPKAASGILCRPDLRQPAHDYRLYLYIISTSSSYISSASSSLERTADAAQCLR